MLSRLSDETPLFSAHRLEYLPFRFADAQRDKPSFLISRLAACEESVHDVVFLGGIFFEADGFGEILRGSFSFSFGGINSADAI